MSESKKKRGRPKKDMEVTYKQVRVVEDIHADLTVMAEIVGGSMSDAIAVALEPYKDEIERVRKLREKMGIRKSVEKSRQN